MKTKNWVGLIVSLVCLAFALGGCATPEEKAKKEEQKRALREQRQLASREREAAAEERREAAELKRFQAKYASYSNEQLRFKLATVEEALAAGKEGFDILLRQGNGRGAAYAGELLKQGLREREAIAFELIRRGEERQPRPKHADGSPVASGSGFFISTNGYFVTCDHVVTGAAKIAVQTKAGLLPAALVRRDGGNDLAILKIEGTFPALPIKPSSSAKLGNPVFTIGYPNIATQGSEPKLTSGEISSLSGMADDARCFQVSVPIQPGNSGGPLVNYSGEVVGVISSKLSDLYAIRNTGSVPQGVNYAVKSSLLLVALESLGEAASNCLRGSASSGPADYEKAIGAAKDAIGMVLVY